MFFHINRGKMLETVYDSDIVARITCPEFGRSDDDVHDPFEIVYCDGSDKRLSGVRSSPGYGFQYGVTLSPGCDRYYVPGWQNGTRAYDIATGECIWKSKIKHARRIITHEDRLLTISSDRRLVMFSADTGKEIKRMTTREHSHRLFDISPQYCMCLLPDQRWGIVDKGTLEVACAFHAEALTKVAIRNVLLADGDLIVIRSINSGRDTDAFRYAVSLNETVMKDYDPVIARRQMGLADQLFGLNLSEVKEKSEEELLVEIKKNHDELMKIIQQYTGRKPENS